MKRIKYEARDAAGIIHQRTSHRVYTHTVVVFRGGKEGEARALEHAINDSASYVRTSWSYWLECVERGKAREGVKERLALGIDGAVKSEQDKRRAEHESLAATGHFNLYENVGWCGRLDLAQKLASKTGGIVLAVEAR